MTTQALSDRPSRGFFNAAYFLGELRRSWSSCLLYFLTYFFSLVVPMLDDLSGYRQSDFYDSFTTRELEYYVPALYTVLAMLCALWAGIAACSYLNRRTSAYHFHSMPIRREGLLLVKSAVAVTDFALALLPNILLTMAFSIIIYERPWPIVVLGFYCLFVFVLTYAFVLLCGVLCGTKSFHFIFTGITAFVGPILLSALWLIADTTCYFLRTDYLLWDSAGRSFIPYSSPFIYVVYALEENGKFSLSGFLGLGLIAAVCFALALLLIGRRPTETAESPMVFRPVGAAFKYFVMSMSTIFLGYFFGEIFSNGEFWVLFGMVSGLLLSFMLMNVLIHRNVRKMFSGLVGLITCVVLLAGGCFGAYSWFSYKDTHGYDADDIVSVSLSDVPRMLDAFTVTDPAAIEAAAAFIDGYFAEVAVDEHQGSPIVRVYSVEDTPVETIDMGDGTELTIDTKYYTLDVTDTVYLRQTNKWGFSRTWRIYLWLYPELDDITETLTRSIANSEEFRNTYLGLLISTENSQLLQRVEQYESGDNWFTLEHDAYAGYIATSPTYAEIEAETRALLGYDLFQTRRITAVETYHNGIWYELPVFEGQTKLIEVLEDGRDAASIIEEEVSRFVAMNVDEKNNAVYAIRTDHDTGEVVRVVNVTGRALLTELCRSALNYDGGRGQAHFLSRVDPDYSLQNHGGGYHLQFAYGKVPQALIDLLK